MFVLPPSWSLKLLPSRRGWLVAIASLLVLLGAHGLTLLHQTEPEVALWHPTAGVAIALTLWFGPMEVLLTMLAAVLMAPWWGGEGWSRGLGILDSLEPLTVWLLYRRLWRGPISLAGVPNWVAFWVSGPLVAGLASAAVINGLLVLTGRISLLSLGPSVLHSWLSNALGILAIAPIALWSLTPWLRRQRWLPRAAGPVELWPKPAAASTEILILFGVVALLCVLTVGRAAIAGPLFYQGLLLIFFPLVWAAVRLGLVGTAALVSFSIAVSLFSYLLFYPPNFLALTFPVDAGVLYGHRLSLFCQGSVALLLAMAIAPRRSPGSDAPGLAQTDLLQLNRSLAQANTRLAQVNQALQLSEERFRASMENLPDCFAICVTQRDDQQRIQYFQIAYLNDAASQALGPNLWLGQDFLAALADYPADELRQACTQVVETGDPVSREIVVSGTSPDALPIVRALDIRIAKLWDGFVATWRDITARKRSELELYRRQQEFKALVEQSPDVVARIDREGRYQYVNPAIARVTSWTPEDVIGRSRAELLGPTEDFSTWQTLLDSIFTTGQEQTREFSAVGPDGALRYFQARLVPEFSQAGAIVSVLSIARDITSMRETEAALRRSEALSRTVLKNLPNGAVFLFDQDLRYTLVEGAGLVAVNLVPEALEGRTIWDALPPDVCAVIEPFYRQTLAGQSVVTEMMFREHVYHVHSMPVRNEEGEILAGLVMTQDVTDLKRAQLSLQESEARLRLALEVANLGTWYYSGADGRVQWSRRCKAMLGLEASETTVGQNPFEDCVHPEDADELQAQIGAAIAQGTSCEAEFRVVWPDGEVRWVAVTGRSFQEEPDRPAHMLGVAMDITARKAADEALRQSEARLRRLVESNLIGVMFVDIGGRLLDANDAFLNLMGYTRAELEAGELSWQAMTPPEYQPRDQQAIAEILTTGVATPFEKEYLHRDGHRVPVLLGVTQLDRACTECACFVLDLTERQRSEAQHQQLVALVENSTDFIGLADLDGAPLFLNQAGRRLVGLDRPGALEQIQHFLAFFPESDRSLVQETVLPSLEAIGYWQGEMEFRHFQTGQSIPVLYNVFVVKHPHTGQPAAIATVSRDITAQKRLEAERADLLTREQTARQQAEAASRLKDEFLAIVSHELRSPLNAILGWARLLRTRRLDTEKVDRALEVIERNAQAQSQLIEDLLDISRVIRGKLRLYLRPTNLARALEAALDTVRPTASAKHLQLLIQIAPSVFVSGDFDRLQQVAWNLLSNAVKFTPEGGQVTVVLVSQESHAEFSVMDTGQGIAPDFLPYVFERFRQADDTTSRSQGGLGLGLAIVRNLVELHGGTISVESPGIGCGATFRVRLPLLQNSQPAPEEDAGSAAVLDDLQPLRGLRVLVVDDEPDTREFMAAVLEQQGATVLTAASAQEAIALIHRDRPDALLSDVGMPLEDGYSLIRRIRALPADRGGGIPAAAVTAYAREEDRRQAIAAGFQLHVAKPIEPRKLVATVAKLVGRSSVT
ncbi:PAS domain S-box protein [Geitlerinema sp. PCC 7407]|uniref:PAS domain S-box protein n=1 Tax=Geitlerinema sp. PCC 7407 TaxID=1173025 RepID=UPI000310C8DA|nr:PAS domain S-box protein [Geitlerinema sp. PCC 7407]